MNLILSFITALTVQSASAPPTVTPEQAELIRQAFNAPVGTEIEVEITNKDGGSLYTSEAGKGVGAGATAEGDKLSDQFTGSAPAVNSGRLTATGGSSQREAAASAVQVPPVPWQNPLFWIGLALLAGAGFCVYMAKRVNRPAMICAAAGVGALAAAFYPWLLLWAVGAVVVILAVPYIKAELDKDGARVDADVAEYNLSRAWEALRAVVAGVEHKDVPPEATAAVKAAVAKESDAADREVIDAVKQADNIGKYAE